MAGTNKIGVAEMRERVSLIVRLLCKGWDAKRIFAYADSELNWNVGLTQVRNYIQRAEKYLSKEAKIDRDYLIQEALSRYSMLYEANADTNPTLALEIQDRINSLMSLKEYQKVEDINAPFTSITDIRFEKIERDESDN